MTDEPTQIRLNRLFDTPEQLADFMKDYPADTVVHTFENEDGKIIPTIETVLKTTKVKVK